MQQQQWSATELEKLQDKLTELESELRDVDETLNIARDELSRVEKEMVRHEQQQSTTTAAEGRNIKPSDPAMMRAQWAQAEKRQHDLQIELHKIREDKRLGL
eukprot:PhF_6_TR25512/c1_g1_i2/m.35618